MNADVGDRIVVDEHRIGEPDRDGITAVVPLGTARQIVVRPVERRDAAALEALYGAMDDDDRHRRFFCAYRPPATWFAALADPDSHGGARLVAEVQTDGHVELIGEAGYAGLPNGNGDVALLIARRWRGWLGPYLVARLTDIAARRGVPNLEADVLTENRPMLALLRHFGAVVIEHDGWSTVRVRIGTSGASPTWDGAGSGPRVLVETPGGRWTGEDDARQTDISLLACFGPASNPRCPALDGHPCPLAADADVIVVRYPPGDETWARLIAAHRELHPDTAVILEALGRPGPPPAGIDEVTRVARPVRRPHTR